MSETDSDQPVIITARQRAHPATRKLAWACIALVQRLAAPPPSASGEHRVPEEQPHG